MSSPAPTPTSAPGSGTPAPLHVAADLASQAAIVESLRSVGWDCVEGFCPEVDGDDAWELSGSGVVCTGNVEAESDVAHALEAVARGAGLVVVVDLADPLAVESFVHQLERMGEVSVGIDDAAHHEPVALSRDEAALLDALAAGASIVEAARSRQLSLRTANRRLLSARRALGVDSTRAAVVEHEIRKRAHRDAGPEVSRGRVPRFGNDGQENALHDCTDP